MDFAQRLSVVYLYWSSCHAVAVDLWMNESRARKWINSAADKHSTVDQGNRMRDEEAGQQSYVVMSR